MTKKVTVSIPDFLHQKMERWRRSFNLSKMLQDAITDAIQRKEDFHKRIQEDLNLNEVVERLKREKAHSEGNYLDSGRVDGMMWAKTAHYDDIQYALAWDDLEKACDDAVLGEYFSGRIARIREKDIRIEGNDEFVRAYLKGWQKGLNEFWAEIKDKL